MDLRVEVEFQVHLVPLDLQEQRLMSQIYYVHTDVGNVMNSFLFMRDSL